MVFFGLYSFAFRHFGSYGVAAVVGECGACLARIPLESIKLRMQVGELAISMKTNSQIVKHTELLNMKVFANGFAVSVIRDASFAMIQFPAFEFLKTTDFLSYTGNFCSAFSGMLAGMLAATLTCPLDVVRSRVMTGCTPKVPIGNLLVDMIEKKGFCSFFSGLKQRVLWISLGGFIFLGSYDFFLRLMFN